MYRQTQGKEDTEALEQLYHRIWSQPASPYALSAIANAWPQILNLERQEADQSIHLRYHRYGIMLTNYFTWWWLDCFVVGKVKDILQKTPASSDNWLTKLVKKIKDIQFARITSYTFNPIHFDSKLPGQVFEYRRHPRTLQWDSDPEQHYKEITSTVIEIVQHWLGFPMEGAYRQKAWFVHALLQEFGQSVLLLDQTWNAYDTMRRSMFSIPPSNPQSFDSVKPLREAARQHPLHDPESEEHKVLDRITESILAVCNVNLPINGRTSAPNTLTPAVQSVLDRRLTIFTSFVRDAVHAVLQPNSNLQTTSLAYKAMIANPDRYLPFREWAPSRIRFKSQDGPFHESVVRTRSGLFSALIWRGITFTTPFSLERKMVFHSLLEFQDEVSAVRRSQSDSRYICNPSAYGVYNKSRSPKLAEDYWEATGKHDWSSFVKNQTVPFTDCYQQFFRPGKAPARFPQIGSLAAYLLTVDYMYAGIVDPPTLDDISDVVRCINRGAASGLEHLGLIGPRVKNKRGQGYSMPNEAECRGAIRKLWEVLASVISIEEQQYLPVDGILVEHISCKFSRCVRKGIIKL